MMLMISVRIPQKNKIVEIQGPRSVQDILAETGHRPATVIVTCERRLLTRDHRVDDGATIDIVSVVSGG